MKKFILGLLIGLVLGTITGAIAKTVYESASLDAASQVIYGNYNGTIVPIKVGSDGTLQTQ